MDVLVAVDPDGWFNITSRSPTCVVLSAVGLKVYVSCIPPIACVAPLPVVPTVLSMKIRAREILVVVPNPTKPF